MTVQYVEVTSITCDKCGETVDYVQHEEYPGSLEMELYDDFIIKLEKQGWFLGDDEKGSDLCPKCNKEVSK
jgi:uncharacterized protein (UPF0212 family)